MIQAQTLLKVVDNSGAKLVRCIKIKKGKSSAGVGDILLVSVKSLRPRYGRRVRLKMNKSEIHQAVVVQTRKLHRSKSGVGSSFGCNSVALISLQEKPIGTRISAIIPTRLRALKWAKLVAMARKTI
uniref:Ribosomal protein L14 n=1 Tax=Sargassum horneri TaxID=74089 RepID=A0A068LMD5_9PHAE|nr:ribosomal protein L14 [Sargassum horneri]AIE46189.1 ribosomal protein L14 [Sargassum horneri]AWW89652.1 ribosomal protein L14 [Sargassum horneri]AWW89689.1 ribosomal protein L14 [Sargassum horneri]AWW89726.1 ribosomal protein L14 [Sargassum horneri]AWW89763.1 ribosomal protein L14 [Sargassum horneri]